MAEGHAVARWGDSLKALIGETVVEIRAPRRWQERAAALVGACVSGVRTHGKHLVVCFSNSLLIHSHALQFGSWQIGERGLIPRKEARFIRLRLVTDAHEALFFHGPVMEILTPDEFAVHKRFHGLGPDLLHVDFHVETAVARMQSQGTRQIGEVVLDQRVVAGIGNIFKSEGLFLAGIHPRQPAARVSAEDLRELFGALIPLMQAARFTYGATVTLPAELRWDGWTRNWVYRRRGQPCFVCARPIQMIRQGELQRATYFCRRCQPRTPPS